MQITLKQAEIETALRQFISHNGINLAGKTVEIDFTAGRKAGGLIAEVSIEDTNAGAEAPSKPVKLVTEEAVATQDQAVAMPVEGAPVGVAANEAPAAEVGKSLFG